MDYEVLKRLLSALEVRGVTYAIFGGIALNLHGLARFTEDVDIFIPPDADNIERLKAALRDVIRRLPSRIWRSSGYHSRTSRCRL
ncbi:MAG: nucleotidyl transferase AbiEii/AbiGii toxin family protein [Vicinamibacterales bacterium]